MRVTEGDASVSHTAGSEVQCLSQGTLLRPSQTRLFPHQVSCKPLVSALALRELKGAGSCR